jgi:hypothetical protein
VKRLRSNLTTNGQFRNSRAIIDDVKFSRKLEDRRIPQSKWRNSKVTKDSVSRTCEQSDAESAQDCDSLPEQRRPVVGKWARHGHETIGTWQPPIITIVTAPNVLRQISETMQYHAEAHCTYSLVPMFPSVASYGDGELDKPSTCIVTNIDYTSVVI